LHGNLDTALQISVEYIFSSMHCYFLTLEFPGFCVLISESISLAIRQRLVVQEKSNYAVQLNDNQIGNTGDARDHHLYHHEKKKLERTPCMIKPMLK
jgi:hypothetical protein